MQIIVLCKTELREMISIFITNPNQRIVTVIGDKEKGDGRIYGTITRRAERIAARLLNDSLTAYLLYIHLALHQNNYVFAFSPAALQEELGISKDRCRAAFNKLVQRGFLVRKAAGNKDYIFYELPPQYEDIADEEDIRIDAMRSATEVSPCTTIPEQTPIPPPDTISMSSNTDIPFADNSYMRPSVEGYSGESIEGVPVEGDRNITNTTIYTTPDNTENIALDESSGSRRESVFDRYGFSRIIFDEHGEPDEEHVNAFWPIPDEVKYKHGHNRDYDDGELPF